jgi:hypothetical protein
MPVLTEKRLTIGMIVLLAGILVASLFERPPASATSASGTGASGLRMINGVAKVGFDYIKDSDYAFDANLPPETPQPPPARLKELDGKTVEITGFVMPIYTPDETKIEFLLAQSPNGCCFGLPPQLQHIVLVSATGLQLDMEDLSTPYTVRGKFSVGVDRDEAGYVTSLLRLTAESVAPAQ